MKKKVLDVGQCGLDHPRIKQMIESSFDAEVDRAHTAQEATQLATGGYDLIMVNRLLDADGSSGVGLIETLKQKEETASIPVMLVSNYEDAQAEAISAGAEPGFGKNAVGNANTISLLAPFCG